MTQDPALLRRDQSIEAFMGAVAETPDLWLSIEIRVFAMRVDGAWHNVLTRCVLDARDPSDVPRLDGLPNTERVFCVQQVRPIADLKALLHEFVSGALAVHDRVVLYETRSGTAGQSPSRVPYLDAYAMPAVRTQSASSSIMTPRDFIAHELRLRPAGGNSFVTELIADPAVDRELYALDKPWEGLEGLTRVAIGSSGNVRHSDAPRVEIVAPLGIAFEPDSLRFSDGRVSSTVAALSRSVAARASVGYIVEHEDASYRNGTMRLERRWRGRERRRARTTLFVGSEARRVTLLLRLGPHLIETQRLADSGRRAENLRLAVSRAQGDTELFRAALQTNEREARKGGAAAHRFEHAIAQLFSLAGFHVEMPGSYGATDAVDVLAFTPDDSSLLAIECTLGALNSSDGKPNRLAARVDELRRNEQLIGVEVLPVMVTSRRRDAVPNGDLEFAASGSITVLCQENIQEILRLVESGSRVSDLLLYCRRVTTNDREGGLDFLTGHA